MIWSRFQNGNKILGYLVGMRSGLTILSKASFHNHFDCGQYRSYRVTLNQIRNHIQIHVRQTYNYCKWYKDSNHLVNSCYHSPRHDIYFYLYKPFILIGVILCKQASHFINQRKYSINSHADTPVHPYKLLAYHIQLVHDINPHNAGEPQHLLGEYRWYLIPVTVINYDKSLGYMFLWIQ